MSERQCGNCKYFSNYYIIAESYLRKTANGQCKCFDVPWRKRKPKTEENAACEYWLSNEHVEEERMEHIHFSLLKMAKRIEEIAYILKRENSDT